MEHKGEQPKKEKKGKAEKPKQEGKKEEGEDKDKDEVGPRLFSQMDLRVSEIVECWKVRICPTVAPGL